MSHTSNMGILQFSFQPPKKQQGSHSFIQNTLVDRSDLPPPQVDPIGTNISPPTQPP